MFRQPPISSKTKDWMWNASQINGIFFRNEISTMDRVLTRPLIVANVLSMCIQFCPCYGKNVAASRTVLQSTTGLNYVTANGMSDSDYDPRLGWLTDGTKYIGTGIFPSDSSVDEGMGVYLRTAQVSSTTNRCLAGGQNSDGLRVNRLSMNRGNGGSSVPGAIQGAYGDGAQNAVGTSLTEGFYHVVRTGSSTCKLYKNGIQIGVTNSMSVRAATGMAVTVMCLNLQGTGTTVFLASGSRVAGHHLDMGLSDSGATRLYQSIQEWNKLIGRSV